MKNYQNLILGFLVLILITAACKKKDETLTFTGISALEGNVGDEITLTGSALNTNLIVTFGDIEATEKTGGGKELKVKVPNGSTKGKIRVVQGRNQFESAQDFTTNNYIQNVTDYQGLPIVYEIPLLYRNNKVWFKKDISQNGGTLISNNTATPIQQRYRQAAYVNWNTAQSICPQGWCLPTIEENNNLAGFNSATQNYQECYEFLTGPNYLLDFNGFVSFNPLVLNNEGSYGYLWTSSELNANEAYVLRISKNVAPRYVHTESGKTFGACVRCVKDLL